MRASQVRWLRGALRAVALTGAAISFIGGCAAFVVPEIVKPSAIPLRSMGVATAILLLWLSRSLKQTPEIAPLWKRGVYTIVWYIWFAGYVLYFVTRPEPGPSSSALQRASSL